LPIFVLMLWHDLRDDEKIVIHEDSRDL
jgi:hypothetical protein